MLTDHELDIDLQICSNEILAYDAKRSGNWQRMIGLTLVVTFTNTNYLIKCSGKSSPKTAHFCLSLLIQISSYNCHCFNMECSSSDFTVCSKIDMIIICILWCVMMNFENDKFSLKISKLHVPTDSPSRGTDVAVFLLLHLCLKALSTVFHSINSPDNPPLSYSVPLV